MYRKPETHCYGSGYRERALRESTLLRLLFLTIWYSRLLKNSFDHPPDPLPDQEGAFTEGGRIYIWGDSPDPSRGAVPLWTPLFHYPDRSVLLG